MAHMLPLNGKSNAEGEVGGAGSHPRVNADGEGRGFKNLIKSS